MGRNGQSFLEYGIVVTVLILLVLYLFHFHVKALPFDSDRWKKGSGSVRHRMVSDMLFKCGNLKGFHVDDVKKLLGPPDHETADRKTLHYGLEYMALSIRLDDTGMVANTELSD